MCMKRLWFTQKCPQCFTYRKHRSMTIALHTTPSVSWHCVGHRSWASAGFFPGGRHEGIFPKFFQGRPKVMKFFFHTRNCEHNLFLLKFSKSRGECSPWSPFRCPRSQIFIWTPLSTLTDPGLRPLAIQADRFFDLSRRLNKNQVTSRTPAAAKIPEVFCEDARSVLRRCPKPTHHQNAGGCEDTRSVLAKMPETYSPAERRRLRRYPKRFAKMPEAYSPAERRRLRRYPKCFSEDARNLLTSRTQAAAKMPEAFWNESCPARKPPRAGPVMSPIEKLMFHRPDTRPCWAKAESRSFSSLYNSSS